MIEISDIQICTFVVRINVCKMVLGKKKEKFYNCLVCGFKFSNLDVPRSCSNCFACTGCEIYVCPKCEEEVVIKAMKPMKKNEQADNMQ